MGRMLQDVVRIDVIWDLYREDSLKAQTGYNLGAGNQLWVTNNTSIPVNWKNLLHIHAKKMVCSSLHMENKSSRWWPKFGVSYVWSLLLALHSWRSWYMASVSCFPCISSWIFQGDDTCNRYWCGGSHNCCIKCFTGLWNMGTIWAWF